MSGNKQDERHLGHAAGRKGLESSQSVFIGISSDLHREENTIEYAFVCHDGMGICDSEHGQIDLLKDASDEEIQDFVAKKFLEKGRDWAHEEGYKVELIAHFETTLPELFHPVPPGLERVLGSGLDGKEEKKKRMPTLLPLIWMKLDAMPFMIPKTMVPGAMRHSHGKYKLDALATYAVQEAITYLHPMVKSSVDAKVDPIYRKVLVDADFRIHMTDLNQYAKITSPQLWKSFMALARLHAKHNTKVAFLSATPSGGGVALMRHALIRLWHLCDADVSWRVPLGDPAVFKITKGKFHNVLQNKEAPGTKLTDEDKALFEDWTKHNIEAFWTEDSPFDSDIVVIDDPQLTACIPYIKKNYPKTKVIFRSHIQIESHLVDKGDTIQSEVFSYLFSFIKHADLFVAHPVKAFVPKCVREHMPVVYLAPSTDPLDGLNKPLSPRATEIYKARFNKLAEEQGNKPVDWKRGYIVQVARFDPSKGYDDLVEAYKLFRDNMKKEKPDQPCPQLVLTGNASVDDPDGKRILQEIHKQIARDDYPYRDDVITVKLPPLDQLLNTIIRCSWLCCQVSTKEGFEVKVTEAIHKGVPVVATRAGGIPLQIREGIDGALVDVSDTQAMADLFFKKATGAEDLPGIFKKPFEDGKNSSDDLAPIGGRWESDGFGANEEYFTVANAAQWALLWARTLYNDDKDLEGLPKLAIDELKRMDVATGSKELYAGITDQVVYTSISGKPSNLS